MGAAYSTLEAVEGIQRANSGDEIAACLIACAARQGFEHYHIGRSASHEVPLVKKSMIAVWPRAWFEQYDQQRLAQHDVIAQSCKTSIRAFRWSDIPIVGDIAQRVMQIAGHDFGLCDGLCVPYFGIDGYQGAVSFGGRKIAASREGDLMLEVVAIYAFNRLNEMRLAEPVGKLLTARQREVLQWVACGKTAWDTATILRVSENTVKKTIKSAMKRLDVYTRAQAVAEALRLREISF